MAVGKSQKVTKSGSRTPKNYLVDYGVLGTGHDSKAAAILLSVQPNLEEFPYTTPAKYLHALWGKAEKHKDFTTGIRGKTFELMVACVLIKEKIFPFYWQAAMEFVPLANFDLVICTKEIGPIALSLKTSIRERFKQAEFEAQALKSVHRRAKTYLITMNVDEANYVNSKIGEGIIYGIDRAVVANRPEFNEVISEIKKFTIIKAPNVSTVTSGNKIDRRKN